MPLPLGHTAIGWAVYETAKTSSSMACHIPRRRIASYAYITLLANLPDLDVLFGLFINGNGAAFHRGPTHSMLFAVLAGYLASKGWRLWSSIPRFGFGLCVMLVFSHVTADMLLTSSPVSLLWPLELNLSSGHNGWGQVMHMVLFQSIRDAGIVIGCMVYVSLLRFLRNRRPAFPLVAFAKRRAK